jgi:competence CoiA-like predicted nuclease
MKTKEEANEKAFSLINSYREPVVTVACKLCGKPVELKRGQLNICCGINYQAGF